MTLTERELPWIFRKRNWKKNNSDIFWWNFDFTTTFAGETSHFDNNSCHFPQINNVCEFNELWIYVIHTDWYCWSFLNESSSLAMRWFHLWKWEVFFHNFVKTPNKTLTFYSLCDFSVDCPPAVSIFVLCLVRNWRSLVR